MIHYKPFVKRLNFNSFGDEHEPFIIHMPSAGVKTASCITPELIKWSDENPHPKGVERLISTALGSFEGYGPNVNGDGFHEKHLCSIPKNVFLGNKAYDKPIYYTFVDFSRLYRFHKNRQHDRSFGDIPFSVYNPEMRRVEVVIDIYANDSDNYEILNDLEHNIYPALSMGYRCVPGDICSCCLNYNKPFPTRGHYCDHLKNHMLEYDSETGQIIYAINHNGYFFDLSLVRKPADRIAWGMKRITVPVQGITNDKKLSKHASLSAPEFIGYSSKLAEEDGSAQIINAIEHTGLLQPEEKIGLPDDIRIVLEKNPDPDFCKYGLELVYRTDIPINKEMLNSISSRYTMQEITATFAGTGVIPSYQEFQRMVLVSNGQEKYADQLDKDNYVFDVDFIDFCDDVNCTKGEFNFKLAGEMREMGILDMRSYYAPFLMKRASVIKTALSVGDFIEKYPIIKSPVPIKKIPEDYSQKLIAQGINASAVGRYYQRYPNPVLSDGRYISPRPEGVTVMHTANPLIPLAIIGSMYAGAKWLSSFSDQGPLGRAMSKNPLIAAGAFGAAAVISWLVGRINIKRPEKTGSARGKMIKEMAGIGKDYMLHLLSGVALAYGLANRAETKREMGVQPNIMEEAFEKRPAIGALILATAIGLGTRAITKFASDDLRRFEDGIEQNDYLIAEYPHDYVDKMARQSLVISALKLKSA